MDHGSCHLPFRDESPVVIRSGRKEDEPFVREFTRNTFSWGDYVGEAFSEWLDEPGEVLVAEFQGRVVGVTHVCYLSPSEAWFEGIRVHPRFRRMGIGMLLSRASIKAARKHGCKVARCAIDSANAASSELARRLGFRLVAKLTELVRSFTWDSLVTSRSPFTVRKAEEKDFIPIWSKAYREINYIGSDFRWRSLSPENVRRAISSGNVVVAVDESGNVEAGASFSEVWEDRKDSRLSGFYVETSSVFGSRAGIQAIIERALDLLREEVLSLSGENAARNCRSQTAAIPDYPSGQAVMSGSVEQGDGVSLKDLSFKVYSLCEIASPARRALLELGFTEERQPPGDRFRADGIPCEGGVLDYDVGIWEMDL